MKKYYFINNQIQQGPFNLEELKLKGLNNNTMIWTEDLIEWTNIMEIPELVSFLNLSKQPPPIPKNKENLNTIPHKKNLTSTLSFSKNEIKLILIFIGINAFALVVSYAKIPFLGDGRPSTKEFWPFVDFVEYYYQPAPGEVSPGYMNGTYIANFTSIFHDYDWSEFVIYVMTFGIIFCLIKLSNRNKKGLTLTKLKKDIKLHKIAYIFLLIWLGINFFALISSYFQWPYLGGKFIPHKNDFWPLVDFTSYYGNKNFIGLFADYDMTEFATYSILGLLIFIIYLKRNKTLGN